MALSVQQIKSIKFTRLLLHEQIEIKKKGRPLPNLCINQKGISKNRRYIRSFTREWYKKIKWLCGCESSNALFCFPCLLYGGESMWTEAGYTNINRIKEKCEKHENSLKHMQNVISLSLLGEVDFPEKLSGVTKISRLKPNEYVKKNREILSKIIDCIKLFSKFKLSFQDHDESDTFENPGVFEGLINFIAAVDPNLQKHLENNSVFKGTSKTILNELLQCMLKVCHDHIISEINKTSYVAVMADDTSDISDNIQTVIVFRYELRGSIFERFWGFFTLENMIADSLSKCLLNELNKILKDSPDKLIAQSYDGANVMRDEKGHAGVQYKIQEVFKNAHFIHCYAHHHNLVMKHAISSIESLRLFYANFSGIATFFSKHSQRMKILNKYVNTQNPSPSCTRGNFCVFENKDNLIKCFEELQSLATQDKTIQVSTGFLTLLQNETFVFWLKLFHKIIPHVGILYNQMQCKSVDANKIQIALNQFYEIISKIRYSETCTLGNLKKIIETKEVCDKICEEAKERFMFTYHLIAATLLYKKNFEIFNKELPINVITETCKVYPFLVQTKLETELTIFYSRKELHNFKGLLALLNVFNEENLEIVFSELIKLIKILVTIPMTTSEPERCFSALNIAKSYLRNPFNQEQLTALSMISIERNMISEIVNFNELVIDKFCEGNDRRMDFILE